MNARTSRSIISSNSIELAADLARGAYRPIEIINLKERIEGETRAAELNSFVTGNIDDRRIKKIVKMKRALDGMYNDWIEGRFQ